MTFNISSSNFDNDDFELDEDSSGDLVLTHKDSGATFKYDSSESVWIPSGGLGSANNPVSSIHSDSVNAGIGVTEKEFNDKLTPKTAQEIADAVTEANNNGGGYLIELPKAPVKESEIAFSSSQLPVTIEVDDVWIRGQGEGQTVLDGHGTGSPVFKVTALSNYQNVNFSDFRAEADTDSVPVMWLENWHGAISEVTVQGAGSGSSTAGNAGFRLEGCNASRITQSSAIGCFSGVYHRDSADNAPTRAQVTHCELTSNRIGMTWEHTGEHNGTAHTLLSFSNLMELNDDQGLFVKGVQNPIVLADRYSRNNQTTGTDADIRLRAGSINGEGGLIGGGTECDSNGGNSTTGIDVDNWDSYNGSGLTVRDVWFRDGGVGVFDRGGASDVNVVACKFDAVSTPMAGNGVRPRWGGVIGGGPLGGVDLGATTGQYVGDEAMADGTTGTAYLDARWTGSAWQQSDGSATI